MRGARPTTHPTPIAVLSDFKTTHSTASSSLVSVTRLVGHSPEECKLHSTSSIWPDTATNHKHRLPSPQRGRGAGGEGDLPAESSPETVFWMCLLRRGAEVHRLGHQPRRVLCAIGCPPWFDALAAVCTYLHLANRFNSLALSGNDSHCCA
jgi:hypothetical protein